MVFSIRDGRRPFNCLANQSGQGIVEYILVLVVTVIIILTGIYQLNTAFQAYAKNYFGNYLACLMETGEMPSIGGAPGDSGICAEMFEAFSWEKGKPMKHAFGTGGGSGSGSGGTGGAPGSKGGRGGGSNPTAGTSERGGGGGGSTGSFGRGSTFRANNQSAAGKGRGPGKKLGGLNTGDTSASDYGGGYTPLNKKISKGVKYRLDNRFVMERENEEKVSRKVSSTTKPNDGSVRSPRMKLRDPKKLLADGQMPEDSEMTFSDFIRILIIAALIIALAVFLGGQAMSISKSME